MGNEKEDGHGKNFYEAKSYYVFFYSRPGQLSSSEQKSAIIQILRNLQQPTYLNGFSKTRKLQFSGYSRSNFTKCGTERLSDSGSAGVQK